MTFTEYLHTQPVLCGLCIIAILLIVVIVVYETMWNTDKLSSLSYFAVLLTILLILGITGGISDYHIEQKAINGNYTVYIDGEQSFTTSPKEAFLDNKHLYSYINAKNGWVLCESKPEDRGTTKYFNKYNKEVPEQ